LRGREKRFENIQYNNVEKRSPGFIETGCAGPDKRTQ